MKNNLLTWIILTALLMLGLPWLTIICMRSMDGLGVILMLFYGVNPVYTIVNGFFAGKNIKKLWALPLITGAFFILGTWLIFNMGELVFLLYGGIYAALGALTMFFTAWLRKRPTGV